MTQESPADYWENHYGERDQIWSGRANAALVDTVGGLPAGRALDLGCGEGADSIWLATRGWQVTAVDVSRTAVERAQRGAAEAGVNERISWVVSDLAGWQPEEEYDLVSACFLHSPRDHFPRTNVLQRAAGAVAAGGHLLVVGHGEPPPWWRHHDHDNDVEEHEHRLLSSEQERAELDLDQSAWAVAVSDMRSRPATGPDGEQATLEDAVLLLRRR